MSDNNKLPKVPDKKLSTLDRIRKSYETDEITLSRKELLLKQIYIEAFTFMSEGNSPIQAANMLLKNRKIPMSTALRHVKNSSILFGNVSEMSVRGEKVILKERLWALYKEAVDNGKLSEARKIINSLADLLPEEKDQLFDFDKMQETQIVIQIHDALETIMKSNISKGVVNLNDLAEDIDFKEVNPDDLGEDVDFKEVD